MDYSQFDLFQVPNDYENKIFERAKILKSLVQQAYSNINISAIDNAVIKKFAVLNVNVAISHVRERELIVEPNSPKMFIWQFVPSMILEVNGNKTTVVDKKDSLKDMSSRIIPKWINSLFTTNSFSQHEFLQLATQYYTLELLNIILADPELVDKISDLVGDKALIIYTESKILPKRGEPSSSLFERDLMNKIKNFYFKIKNLNRTNWYFIGYNHDFTNENDLLKLLDDNQHIKKQKDIAFGKAKTDGELLSTYQNDYLFLNNTEWFRIKPNTDDWECSFVVDPLALNSNFDDFIDLYHKSTGFDFREIFCYIKKGDGDNFVRYELLFPNKKIHKDELTQILSISQKLKDA